MLFIKKSLEQPLFLEEWKNKHEQEILNLFTSESKLGAKLLWEEFRKTNPFSSENQGCERSETYKSLKQLLLKEQGYLCAYCNKKIRDDKNTLIEHIIEKEIAPCLTLDYHNLVACCQGGSDKEHILSKNDNRYCDKSKDDYRNKYKKDQSNNFFLKIVPLSSKCEDIIIYDRYGSLNFNHNCDFDFEDFEKDIEKALNLNSRALREERQNIIDSWLYENIEDYRMAKKKYSKPPELNLIRKNKMCRNVEILRTDIEKLREGNPIELEPFCLAIIHSFQNEINNK